jgi:dihydroorotate dehydrogenase
MYAFITKLLFRLDAEKIHHQSTRLIRWASVCPRLLRAISQAPPPSPTEVAGITFRNPIGLAAGFDKDAELLLALPHLGFGFVEVGTVTLQAQVGNAKPRLFRIPESRSLFNRMGFNSKGAGIVAENIKRAQGKLPKDFRIGVNIGKNKDTPAHQAADEYAVCASFFEGLADYLVVNVSSPNTPGLRALQSLESVSEIVSRIRQVIRRWNPTPPLFVKLAPELAGDAMTVLLNHAESVGIDGFVLTNTLQGEHRSQVGGFSGQCLQERSREVLRMARESFSGPIISVGGIMDSEEVARRQSLGAHLVQTYSGWVYGGPRFVGELLKGWKK